MLLIKIRPKTYPLSFLCLFSGSRHGYRVFITRNAVWEQRGKRYNIDSDPELSSLIDNPFIPLGFRRVVKLATDDPFQRVTNWSDVKISSDPFHRSPTARTLLNRL